MVKLTALVVCVALLFSACNRVEPDTEQSSASQSDMNLTPVTIGVSLADLNDNYLSILKQAMESNDDISINIMITDAEDDPDKQSVDIRQLIEDGAQTLVVSLVNEAQTQSVCDIAEMAGVDVLFLHTQPSQEMMSLYDNAYFIGVNKAESGALQAEMAYENFVSNSQIDTNGDGTLQYVILKGEEENPLTSMRTTSLIQGMDDKDTELLAEINADWNIELAEQLLGELLAQGTVPEAVLCNSDSMALGAIEALAAAEVSAVVYGIDAIPQAIDAIENGELAGTIYDNPYLLAEESLKTAASFARGETVVSSAGTIRIPFETISR